LIGKYMDGMGHYLASLKKSYASKIWHKNMKTVKRWYVYGMSIIYLFKKKNV